METSERLRRVARSAKVRALAALAEKRREQ
jgi:hypothetical protein